MRLSCQVLPLVMLLIGMSTVFIYDTDRRVLYRQFWEVDSGTNLYSSHYLSVAVNLSPSHHFLGFMSRGFDVNGNIDYLAYNRFPPGGYVLIKLVTLPFGDDLSSQIYAARILMLVFFVGTAVLAYLSLCRLTSSRWIASAATLIVFSSTQFLFHNDTMLTDAMPDLFGFALTFHGMVIFVQERRFRQLVIKACLALLLGWHVLALLLVFIFLGLAKEIIKVRKTRTIREIFRAVVASRYFMLGIVAFGFGLLILAYNMGNEYYALNVRGNRQLALSDLPSFHSMLRRTGVSQLSQEGPKTHWFPAGVRLPWVWFLEEQFQRIGSLSVPFALPGPTISITNSQLLNVDANWIRGITRSQEYAIAVAAVGTCVIGMFWVRYRLLAATAILAGFCWSIPMRHQSKMHLYESLYYVSIPLFFFTLILLLIRKWSSERLMPLGSVIALFIFITSSHQMGRAYLPPDDLSVTFNKTVVDDFSAIRKLTRGQNILIPGGGRNYELVRVRYGWHYYLSGRGIVFNEDVSGCDRGLDKVDFMIQTRRDVVPGLLTPDNQRMFLYDRYVYEERIDKIIEENRPVIRGDFDVYLTDDRKLVYVRDRCDGIETNLPILAPFFLHVYPVDVEDIPDIGQSYEFNEFTFVEHRVMDTKRHVAIIDLPDYDIAGISTGQYVGGSRIWGGEFFGPDYAANADLSRRVDQVTASHQPIIRSYFDVYLADNKTLIYVIEPCHNDDISDDFFLHVVPVDIKDLPESRRQYEFDNLDFSFFDRGFKDGRRCAAVIDLPDYDIARIRTGQFTDQAPTWHSEFGFVDD